MPTCSGSNWLGFVWGKHRYGQVSPLTKSCSRLLDFHPAILLFFSSILLLFSSSLLFWLRLIILPSLLPVDGRGIMEGVSGGFGFMSNDVCSKHHWYRTCWLKVMDFAEQLWNESVGVPSDVCALGAVVLVHFGEAPVWPSLLPYWIMCKLAVCQERPKMGHIPPEIQELCNSCFADIAHRPPVKITWLV